MHRGDRCVDVIKIRLKLKIEQILTAGERKWTRNSEKGKEALGENTIHNGWEVGNRQHGQLSIFSVINLGITIDGPLTMRDHVLLICQRACIRHSTNFVSCGSSESCFQLLR